MLSRSRSPREQPSHWLGSPKEEGLRNGDLATTSSQGSGRASFDIPFRRSLPATTTHTTTTTTSTTSPDTVSLKLTAGQTHTPPTTPPPTKVRATMSEEGYPTSNWEHTDSETLASSNLHHRNNKQHHQSYHRSVDSLDIPAHTPLSPTKSPSPGRSSAESPTRNGSSSKWRDSVLAAGGKEPPASEDLVVEASFDESILRALCELDVSFPHYF